MTHDEQMDVIRVNTEWLEARQAELMQRRRTSAVKRRLHEVRLRLQHEGRTLDRLFREMLAAISLVALLLLTGCAGPRTSPSAAASPRAGAHELPSATTNITLTWAHPSTNVEFNVYSAPEPRLAAMTLKARTPARSITFPATGSMEFFGVRAVRGTNESSWATTQ